MSPAGPEKDCAGDAQQQLKTTDPTSRQRGRPTLESKFFEIKGREGEVPEEGPKPNVPLNRTALLQNKQIVSQYLSGYTQYCCCCCCSGLGLSVAPAGRLSQQRQANPPAPPPSRTDTPEHKLLLFPPGDQLSTVFLRCCRLM
jgi:hypothetical protein